MGKEIVIKRVHTHNRRKLNRHYERFTIAQGLMLWYVHTENRIIMLVREREYFDDTFDDCKEKVIEQLPTEIKEAFDNYLLTPTI